MSDKIVPLGVIYRHRIKRPPTPRQQLNGIAMEIEALPEPIDPDDIDEMSRRMAAIATRIRSER